MKLLYIAVISFFISSAFAAKNVTLEPASHTDLRSQVLVPVKQAKNIQAERQPVSFSWEVKDELDLTVRPYSAESREYWVVVNASDFNNGIELPISGEGSLININPVGATEQLSIDPMNLVLVNGDGEIFKEGRGMDTFERAYPKGKQGVFARKSTTIRVTDLMGTGAFTLFADNINYKKNTQYQIHVQEHDSPFSLKFAANNDTFFMGEEVSLDAALLDGDVATAIDAIDGFLISPQGQRLPLKFENGIRASLANLNEASQGLWQAQITVQSLVDGEPVTRMAKTAFAVVAPTAKLLPKATIIDGKDNLTAELNIQTSTTGRFEVRGILFGTNSAGELKPIAIAHYADFLNPGASVLELNYNKAMIEASGLTAPFEIRDLRLIHQNRMSLLHRQETGLKFQ